MPTQGFQLSQLERAPQIPGNIGVVDTKSIYDSVVSALKTNEALRTAQQAQGATDAQLALASQKAQSDMGLVEPEAAARLSQAQFLASPEYARTRQLLSGAQAQGVQEEAALKQQQRARSSRLLTQASLQEDEARQAIDEALSYAPSKTRADELAKIRAKYQWLDMPEFAGLSKMIDSHYKSAMDDYDREEQRLHAFDLAKLRTDTTLQAAKAKALTTEEKLAQVEANLEQAVAEDPENEALQTQYNAFKQLRLAKSATAPKSPTQAMDQKILEKANAAKNQIAALEGKNMMVFNDLNELGRLTDEGVLGKFRNPAQAFVGGAKTTRFNALLSTIQSRELLDSLAQLKQQGGTLGQVTEKEGQQLMDSIAKLSVAMDEKTFREQLEKIRVARQNFVDALKEAYKSDYLSGRRTAAALPGMAVPGAEGMAPAESGFRTPTITTNPEAAGQLAPETIEALKRYQ